MLSPSGRMHPPPWRLRCFRRCLALWRAWAALPCADAVVLVVLMIFRCCCYFSSDSNVSVLKPKTWGRKQGKRIRSGDSLASFEGLVRKTTPHLCLVPYVPRGWWHQMLDSLKDKWLSGARLFQNPPGRPPTLFPSRFWLLSCEHFKVKSEMRGGGCSAIFSQVYISWATIRKLNTNCNLYSKIQSVLLPIVI